MDANNEGKLPDRALNRTCDRRTFLKASSVLAGALAFGLPLAACAPPPAAKKVWEGKAATTAGPMLPTAPYVVGEKKGFFEQEGLKNTWTEFSGGGDTIRSITTGGFQYGIGFWASAAIAFEKGEPIRIIADAWHDTDNGWIVRADSPLKGIQDIRGKKVTYSRVGSNTHMLLLGSLRGAGIKPEEVQLVASGSTPETWTAVKTGVVDVGFCLEPLISQVVLDKEARVLWWAREYIPEWSTAPLVANADFAKENPNVLKGFISGYIKSLDFCKSNRVEAGKIYGQEVGIPQEVAIQGFKNTPDKAFAMKVSKSFLDYLDDLMLEFQQVKQKPNWTGIIDQSFLPDSLRTNI